MVTLYAFENSALLLGIQEYFLAPRGQADSSLKAGHSHDTQPYSPFLYDQSYHSGSIRFWLGQTLTNLISMRISTGFGFWVIVHGLRCIVIWLLLTLIRLHHFWFQLLNSIKNLFQHFNYNRITCTLATISSSTSHTLVTQFTLPGFGLFGGGKQAKFSLSSSDFN